MPEDKKRSNPEPARRIWLAGIGAYGRAFTEAQEALKDVTGKGSEIFEDLVQKGQVIEKVVEVKGKTMMDKAAVPSFDLDDRIKAMRSRLSGNDTDDGFEDRLSVLEAKLDRILELLEPAKAKAKKSVKRASKKRARTVRKNPTAKKKPVTKRPTTKKTHTKKATTKKTAAKK